MALSDYTPEQIAALSPDAQLALLASDTQVGGKEQPTAAKMTKVDLGPAVLDIGTTQLQVTQANASKETGKRFKRGTLVNVVTIREGKRFSSDYLPVDTFAALLANADNEDVGRFADDLLV